MEDSQEMRNYNKIQNLMYLAKQHGLLYTLKYLRMNFYRHLWSGYKMPPLPSHIGIEVTTKCNLRCKFCRHTFWRLNPVDMGFEQFKRIIDQLPLKSIDMTGFGTNFLNKDFIKMLEYLKKKVYIEFFDTGYFIGKKIAKKLIELKVDRITLSIDGIGETYNKLRTGSDFKKITNNVLALQAIKGKLKSNFPELGINCVVCKENIKELEMIIKLACYLDIKYVTFSDLWEYEKTEGMKKKIDKDELVRLGNLHHVFVNIPESSSGNAICSYPFLLMEIMADGNVIPCCAVPNFKSREYLVENSMGNIFKQSAKEIWNGNKYKRLREQLISYPYDKKAPEICEGCKFL